MNKLILLFSILVQLTSLAQAKGLEDELEDLGFGTPHQSEYQAEAQEERPEQSWHWQDDRPELFMAFERSKSEMIGAAMAAGVAVVVFANDQEIMDFVQENKNDVTEHLSEWGEAFGSDATIYATGAGLILGLVLDNHKIKRVSWLAVKAMLYSGLVTRILKTSFQRHRPNKPDGPYAFGGGINHHSFPSGHTTQAFAFATVIAEEFKSTKIIPILSYSAAAIAGWSRVNGEANGSPAHWASDVIIGAIIGHLVAKQVVSDKWAKKGIVITPALNTDGEFSFEILYRQRREQLDPDRPCGPDENPEEHNCQAPLFDEF